MTASVGIVEWERRNDKALLARVQRDGTGSRRSLEPRDVMNIGGLCVPLSKAQMKFAVGLSNLITKGQRSGPQPIGATS